MEVYVMHHKKNEVEYPDGYLPMLVGAQKYEDEFKNGFVGDDTGDNISYLNDSYCEMTGLYWMWKNSTADIIGLVHYRRFFLFLKNRIYFRDHYYVQNPNNKNFCHLLSERETQDLLSSNDVLVKMSRKFHFNNRVKLLQYVSEECVESFEEAIKRFSLDFFNDYELYMKRYSHVLFNMFIGKRAVIEKYCKFIFPILAQTDAIHKEKSGERYHNRELGYLSEVIFGLWLEKNNIRFLNADTLMPGNSQYATIDGITIDGGSNVHRYNEIPQDFMKRLKNLSDAILHKEQR